MKNIHKLGKKRNLILLLACMVRVSLVTFLTIFLQEKNRNRSITRIFVGKCDALLRKS